MSSPTTRRTLLRTGALAGGLGVVWARVPSASSRAALARATGCATLTQELTQGPFWVDERLERSDVRSDSTTGEVQSGLPLTLTLRLQDAGADCTPQVGAYVDIWHASAQGEYSDVSGSGNPDNRGEDWLRGYQVSDEAGEVTFTTIWPGYYRGRTIHIHFRVRTTLADSSEVNFTSQLFFDEDVNAAVLATSAYQQASPRDTTNAADGIYEAAMLTEVTGDVATGYAGTFTVNLDFGDGSGGTPGTPADDVVSATVADARVVRRAGHRVAVLGLDAEEKVTARLRLVRDDRVLASRTWGWLPRGARTLRMRLPADLPGGRAHLQLTLADQAGNTRIARELVRVPGR